MAINGSLEDIFNDDPFGLLDIKPAGTQARNADERLIASFDPRIPLLAPKVRLTISIKKPNNANHVISWTLLDLSTYYGEVDFWLEISNVKDVWRMESESTHCFKAVKKDLRIGDLRILDEKITSTKDVWEYRSLGRPGSQTFSALPYRTIL